MSLPDASDPRGRLLLSALAAYSDACELPALTPGCPFYRETLDGPRCGDECRHLLKDAGLDSGIREVTIGGLILTGHARNLDAPGSVAFDARKEYLSDQHLPAAKRATGSLLLAIGDALDPATDPADTETGALAAELNRRGIDARQVVTDAVLPRVAGALAALSLLPDLLDAASGRVPHPESALAVSEQWRPWTRLLDAAIAGEGGERAAARAAGATAPTALHALIAATPGAGLAAAVTGGGLDLALPAGVSPQALMAHPRLVQRLAYGFCERFLNRLHRTLANMLPTDLADFHGWSAPDPVEFLSMPMEPLAPAPSSQWLWDRFTITHPDEWSFESVRAEWQYTEGRLAPPCHPDTLAARCVSRTALANAAMKRPGPSAVPAPPPDTQALRTVDFVEIAASRLRHGRTSEAAALFAGIVELRPEDADARNNYGFCLMPDDPAAALAELDEARRLGVRPTVVNAANRALTLHLLDRNNDARAVIEETLSAGVRPTGGAFLWWHDPAAETLRLQENASPVASMLWLRDHLTPAADH